MKNIMPSEEDSEEDNKDEVIHGHVNSISVLRSYRRLGLAKKLMLRSREYFSAHVASYLSSTMGRASEDAMATVYKAAYVSLHVRKSNKAAIGLYKDTLGFEVAQVVKKYCQYPYVYLYAGVLAYRYDPLRRWGRRRCIVNATCS